MVKLGNLLPGVDANALELSIMDGERALPEYSARGRTWIAGEAGQSFSVRVRHDGSRPWLVRCLIDGREAEPEVDLSLLPTGHESHVPEEFYSGWLVHGALREFVFEPPATCEEDDGGAAWARGEGAAVGAIELQAWPARISTWEGDCNFQPDAVAAMPFAEGGGSGARAHAAVPEKLTMKEGRSVVAGAGEAVGSYAPCVFKAGDWRLTPLPRAERAAGAAADGDDDDDQDPYGEPVVRMTINYRDAAYLDRLGIRGAAAAAAAAPPSNKRPRVAAATDGAATAAVEDDDVVEASPVKRERAAAVPLVDLSEDDPREGFVDDDARPPAQLPPRQGEGGATTVDAIEVDDDDDDDNEDEGDEDAPVVAAAPPPVPPLEHRDTYNPDEPAVVEDAPRGPEDAPPPPTDVEEDTAPADAALTAEGTAGDGTIPLAAVNVEDDAPSEESAST